jgi:hypothetical protein
MLEPVSVPTAAVIMPAATPAAEPALDPPHQCERDQGLRGTGNGLVSSGNPNANSSVVVLPITIAPAARSRAMHSASPLIDLRSNTRLCAVVSPSSVEMTSFTPRGMPSNGDRDPARRAASAAAAAWSACSSKRDRNTPNVPSLSSAAASAARTSSTLEISPRSRATRALVTSFVGRLTG